MERNILIENLINEIKDQKWKTNPKTISSWEKDKEIYFVCKQIAFDSSKNF